MLDAGPSDRPIDIELETDDTVPLRDVRGPADRIADRDRARSADHPDVEPEYGADAPSPTPDSETVEAEQGRHALLERYTELRTRWAIDKERAVVQRTAMLGDLIERLAPEHREALLGRRDLFSQFDALLNGQPDANTALTALEKTIRRIAETLTEREAKSRAYKTPQKRDGGRHSENVRVQDLSHEERAAEIRDAMRPVIADIKRLDASARSGKRSVKDEPEEPSFFDKVRRVFRRKDDAA